MSRNPRQDLARKRRLRRRNEACRRIGLGSTVRVRDMAIGSDELDEHDEFPAGCQGRAGVVDSECFDGCGATRQDPLFTVRLFRGGTGDFWAEELHLLATS